MSLILGRPPQAYDPQDQAQMRRALEEADGKNIKVGNVFDKILLRDTDTHEIVTLTVASGVVVIA